MTIKREMIQYGTSVKYGLSGYILPTIRYLQNEYTI